MDLTQERPGVATEASQTAVDMKLEAVVIPVSNVDRAADFYRRLGWRVDADIPTPDGRVLQFTPPGSPCSIIFGTGVSPSAPGSTQYLHLIVSDIEAARAELIGKGVNAGDVFHDARGGYNRFDPQTRAKGLDPERRSYASFLTFEDPDGNGWILQEITTRFPGRVDPNATTFSTIADLAGAMRRAETAHGRHEASIGAPDPQWPDWYAAFMAAEQAGTEPPP